MLSLKKSHRSRSLGERPERATEWNESHVIDHSPPCESVSRRSGGEAGRRCLRVRRRPSIPRRTHTICHPRGRKSIDPECPLRRRLPKHGDRKVGPAWPTPMRCSQVGFGEKDHHPLDLQSSVRDQASSSVLQAGSVKTHRWRSGLLQMEYEPPHFDARCARAAAEVRNAGDASRARSPLVVPICSPSRRSGTTSAWGTN
jgi:hypothetical protein